MVPLTFSPSAAQGWNAPGSPAGLCIIIWLFHRLLLCLGAAGCRMWRFAVKRAPSRWAAVRRMIAGAFSATDVTAALVWCHLVMSAPCTLLITRTRRPPLVLFAKKRWNFQSTFFSCAHSLWVSTLVVCKQLFTYSFSPQWSVWCGRAAAQPSAFYPFGGGNHARTPTHTHTSPQSFSKTPTCFQDGSEVATCCWSLFFFFSYARTVECVILGVLLLWWTEYFSGIWLRGTEQIKRKNNHAMLCECLPRP